MHAYIYIYVRIDSALFSPRRCPYGPAEGARRLAVPLPTCGLPIHMYKQYIYKHPADTQFPLRSSSFAFPSHCAGSAHCLARGLIRARLIRLVRLVLDPWRYQVAKGAFSAGPDLGSSSPHRSSCLCHRCSFHLSASSTHLIRSLPCATHGHVGTCPIWT